MRKLHWRALVHYLFAVWLFAASTIEKASGADWPMLGHDIGRSGSTPEEIRPPFARAWYRLFPDEGIQAGVQPIIARDRVFIGTLRGILHAIDATTGKDLWKYGAGGPILHSAAWLDGFVFFGCADGQVYAVNASDGTPCWRVATGAAVWNAPAVHGSRVYIAGRDGKLYAIETVSGRAAWTADLGAPVLNSPAIDGSRGRIYVGSEAMRVHAFELATGKELWRSEKLPGCSMRGYHPVIAPDGAVMVTVEPVIGYDRFQQLLLDMTKEVFGDFASWRHSREENDRLRAENFRLMQNPETYRAQLEYFRRRLSQEPAFQTFFVLDPDNGSQRFIAPVISSESMNGPAAPPLVTPEGKVIVKYQALLRSRYEHYSPFLNVGWLDTRSGHITPLMDESRTYGWHDSLLLVHDEQSQLSLAGHVLINTHQDNVNALDLENLRGWPAPFARNIHEPARGEALAIRMEALRGKQLSPGNEWLMRGTAVYGGGSVLDVPVAVAGKRFYYVPSHELNSGCALIAYEMNPSGNPEAKRVPPGPATLSTEEWKSVQDLPWDWDTLGTSRLKSLTEALPCPVPGTRSAPLRQAAETRVAAITDQELDQIIWTPLLRPDVDRNTGEPGTALELRLNDAVEELLNREWRPLVLPAAKAPEHAYRFFNDRGETAYALLLARPFLRASLREKADAKISELVTGPGSFTYKPDSGESRVPYQVPAQLMRIVDDSVRDDVARLYPLCVWYELGKREEFLKQRWTALKGLLDQPASKSDEDCGNSRLAGLIAYCRLAKASGDAEAMERGLTKTREAMRQRLIFELSHTRGAVIQEVPPGRGVMSRWRRLTPEVAELLRRYALDLEQRLVSAYVDYQRPGWWIAWNVEQLMRNEAPMQLPTTSLEIFNVRALLLQEPASKLEGFVDLPWCKADEFYIEKLALTLRRLGR